IYVDANHKTWIGTRNGLREFENGVLNSYDEKNGVPRSAVTGCYEDRQGTIWMSTEEGGGLRFKDGRFIHYTTADGLSSSSTTAIFQDQEGTLWIGTSNGGLNRLKRQIITTYSERDGLIGKNAYPMLQDQSGNIWIGCAGLFRYQDGTFTRYVHAGPAESRAEGRPYLVPTALFQDRTGVLWIGAVGGLFTFAGGKFAQQPFPSSFVWSIHQTADGTMWLGGTLGLVKYSAGRPEIFNTANGLAGNDVKIIC